MSKKHEVDVLLFAEKLIIGALIASVVGTCMLVGSYIDFLFFTQ